MFSISAKSRYGIAAMIELAGNYGGSLLQIKEIADKRRLPRTYLEQIFNRLGKRGLVRSVRGKNGGYALTVPPSEIPVLSVLEALEGELELAGTEQVQAMRELYLTAEESVRSILSVSLAGLLAQQQASERRIMYHI